MKEKIITFPYFNSGNFKELPPVDILAAVKFKINWFKQLVLAKKKQSHNPRRVPVHTF